MYTIVEEPVLKEWEKLILHYMRYVDDINTFMRYVDDINTFMIITVQQAAEFKKDLTAQSECINFIMVCYRDKSDFLDLKIMIADESFPIFRTCIDNRIHRKPGNSLAYLCANSYHALHTPYTIMITELVRYLTKSSQRDFYVEDAQILYYARRNRGYTRETITRGLCNIKNRLFQSQGIK